MDDRCSVCLLFYFSRVIRITSSFGGKCPKINQSTWPSQKLRVNARLLRSIYDSINQLFNAIAHRPSISVSIFRLPKNSRLSNLISLQTGEKNINKRNQWIKRYLLVLMFNFHVRKSNKFDQTKNSFFSTDAIAYASSSTQEIYVRRHQNAAINHHEIIQKKELKFNRQAFWQTNKQTKKLKRWWWQRAKTKCACHMENECVKWTNATRSHDANYSIRMQQAARINSRQTKTSTHRHRHVTKYPVYPGRI